MAACTIANVKADPDLGVSSSFNYVSIYLYYIYIFINIIINIIKL